MLNVFQICIFMFRSSVLIAEIIKAFIPSLVDLHNYPAALAVDNKLVNWSLLNR